MKTNHGRLTRGRFGLCLAAGILLAASLWAPSNSAGSTALQAQAVAPAQGPWQRLKVPDYDDPNNASAAWPITYLAQFSWVTTYTHMPTRDVSRMRALNPTFKWLLYEMPQRAYGSSIANGDIRAHEAWLLHNPEGSLDPNDRVRRDESGALTWICDIRNSEYRAFIQNLLVGIILKGGLDGFYNDGIHYNADLDFGQRYDANGKVIGNGEWIHPPTRDQTKNWWTWELQYWYPSMRRALGSKLFITSTTPIAPGFDDSAVLPYVDGTLLEFAWSHDYGASDWKYTRSVFSRNTQQSKYTIIIPGPSKTLRTPGPSTLDFYGVYLLDADGKYLVYQGVKFEDGVRHDPENMRMLRDIGVPNANDGHGGKAFQNADGTWTRNFTHLTVRANPSDSPRGGLKAWQSEFTYH